jgi:non-canonical (house-cleaning) NTP pyrophosphatase
VVAIENGVSMRGDVHVDLAYVVVLDSDRHFTVRSSQHVLVPPELVVEAQKVRWTKTCGQFEAARTPGCDPADPHVVWTRGATSRRVLLTDTVEEALRAVLSHALYGRAVK